MKRAALFPSLLLLLASDPSPAVPLQLTHQGRILENGANVDGDGQFKFAIVDGGQDLNRQARASATVQLGRVTRVTLVDPGAGYVSPPQVRLITRIGERGAGATAIALLTDDRIAGITVTNSGSGYTAAPLVVIDPPTAPPVFTTFWSHDASSTGGSEPLSALTLPVHRGLFSVCLGDTKVPNMIRELTAADLASPDPLFLRTWFSSSGDPGTFELLAPDQKIGASAFALRAAVAESVPDGSIGVSQIADGAITGDKIAPRTITSDALAAPGFERVLVSDGNGNAVWMTVGDFLLSQGYTAALPGVVENLCAMEIAGVFADTVQIVNGPGVQIEDLGGSPGESGLNTEFAIVFDYDGPANPDLQGWYENPRGRSGSLIVRDTTGAERYRWNFFEFELASISVGGGNDGKNRYVLRHTEAPNTTLAIERSADWLGNVDRKPGDLQVEISGVSARLWPQVEIDEGAKTLTMTFDYSEGMGIFGWVRDIANAGTFGHGRKDISVIYRDNSDREIGRNNFYGCFPVRYQHFTGFDLQTKGREQVVISYDSAENVTDPVPTLYTPPVIEYFPGTQNLEVPYDYENNRLNILEIEGVVLDDMPPPAVAPVLLSGPGYEIERLAGFDPDGDPDDRSGNNREFPLVLEVGGADLARITDWKNNHDAQLPALQDVKSGSVIFRDAGDVEQFRMNFFLMAPVEITPLPSGRSRVTLYHILPPNNHEGYQWADPPATKWGDALQNNPATDSRIEISGITELYAQVTDDPANRTLTIDYEFGEGGSLWNWTRAIVENGSTNVGKRAIQVTDGGTATNYFGCFPLSIQLVSGFEQDVKAKARIVISYDQSEPAAP